MRNEALKNEGCLPSFRRILNYTVMAATIRPSNMGGTTRCLRENSAMSLQPNLDLSGGTECEDFVSLGYLTFRKNDEGYSQRDRQTSETIFDYDEQFPREFRC